MRAIIARSVLVAVVISIGLGTALGQSSREGGRRDRRRSRSEDRSASADDPAQRNARTEGFLRMLDANHNGMIEAEEVPANQKSLVEGIFHRAGIEPKYPVSVSRILEAIAGGVAQPKPSQPAVPGFGAPSGDGTKPGPTQGSSQPATPPPSSSANSAKSEETSTDSPSKTPDSTIAPSRGSGRFRTPKERLPDGLPDWFRQRDHDGDGQIAMSEFAQQWTPDKAADFNRLDLNHDGIITAAECLKAEKRSSRTAK